jgi:hypothetical protein
MGLVISDYVVKVLDFVCGAPITIGHFGFHCRIFRHFVFLALTHIHRRILSHIFSASIASPTTPMPTPTTPQEDRP